MILGLDLDNTLVCYDQLFWRLATGREWIPAEIPCRKECVRDELRRRGRENDWVLLQGEVYGPRMVEASPFPQVLTALAQLRDAGWQLHIISHRTRAPFAGPSYDLHAAAKNWLHSHGFLDESRTGLNAERVFLETEKAAKLARIQVVGCHGFIDDLPELLTDEKFPAGVQRILFDPHRHCPTVTVPMNRFHDWSAVMDAVQAPPA